MSEPDNYADRRDLSDLLDQLHLELASNPPTDDRSRQSLLTLKQDIERAISLGPGSPVLQDQNPEMHSLRERVQETMASFEGTHPQSAAALERVLVLLSNFGL